jgi:hypothetical protein
MSTSTQTQLVTVKIQGRAWVDQLLQSEFTRTKPGSITHLLYGAKPSEQSINIKFGRYGEVLAKELIGYNKNIELLKCGVQQINDKNKDVDLIWIDKTKKIVYYRELKGNIELDTEKLPATVNKCKEIEQSLKITYPDYVINCGVLNWSIYNRGILTAGLSNIKAFENSGIKIDHMQEFLQHIDFEWSEGDFYQYFRELGEKIKTHFDKLIWKSDIYI